MCIYVYICVYICIHVYIYVYICINMYINIYVHLCIYIYICICMYIYICKCIYIYIRDLTPTTHTPSKGYNGGMLGNHRIFVHISNCQGLEVIPIHSRTISQTVELYVPNHLKRD